MDEGEGLVATAEGAFASSISVEAAGADLPCDVELRAELDETVGTYVVSEVRCSRRRGGAEVTGEAIRAVPVERILRAGAIQVNRLFTPTRNIEEIRAQGPTDENLRLVARIYRLAHLVRDTPTTAVSKALRVPYPTAARWVRQARQRGFLGATEPRKRGERPARRTERKER